MPKANYQFTPSPHEQSFPTALAIASIAGVAVGAVGLLVYLKKRKR
jgi:LPXTG-motif cell wall-anchored protein